MSYSKALAEYVVKHNTKIEDLCDVLRSYGLLSLLPEIKKHVALLETSSQKDGTILIESPFPLNESSLMRIKRIVGNDIAPHEVAITPSLLSGFRARFRGKLYDGSAERIIKKLLSGK